MHLRRRYCRRWRRARLLRSRCNSLPGSTMLVAIYVVSPRIVFVFPRISVQNLNSLLHRARLIVSDLAQFVAARPGSTRPADRWAYCYPGCRAISARRPLLPSGLSWHWSAPRMLRTIGNDRRRIYEHSVLPRGGRRHWSAPRSRRSIANHWNGVPIVISVAGPPEPSPAWDVLPLPVAIRRPAPRIHRYKHPALSGIVRPRTIAEGIPTRVIHRRAPHPSITRYVVVIAVLVQVAEAV